LCQEDSDSCPLVPEALAAALALGLLLGALGPWHGREVEANQRNLDVRLRLFTCMLDRLARLDRQLGTPLGVFQVPVHLDCHEEIHLTEGLGVDHAASLLVTGKTKSVVVEPVT